MLKRMASGVSIQYEVSGSDYDQSNVPAVIPDVETLAKC